MKNTSIDDALLKIIEIKSGSFPPVELSSAVSEALDTIFKETCSNPYLQHCDPEFCTVRSNNNCKYSKEFSRLKEIIKQSNE